MTSQDGISPAPGALRSPRRAWALPVTRPVVVALLLAAGLVLCAASLPRDMLWGVESTCVLNYRTTGSAFPCLEVNIARGAEQGYAVLRAPFRQTHLVAMPTARVIGIETAQLRERDAPGYFADAWEARRYVQADLKRPLAWNDVGLAVNSRVTRSQDQLHIHIDCLRPRVKAALAERLASTPTDHWQEGGYSFMGQSYWTRRIERPSLEGVNPFRLAAAIPALQDHPGLAVLAVVGTTDAGGHDGFMLLAGLSDAALAARQSTSEDLLDHACKLMR